MNRGDTQLKALLMTYDSRVGERGNKKLFHIWVFSEDYAVFDACA